MSGLATAQRVALPVLPALVDGTVHHTRHRPTTYAFTHRAYQWLVDLADPEPVPAWLGPLARFHGEDHLHGRPGLAALREDVLDLVARAGLAAGRVERVVMLANARVLGHVFDPLTAYWCLAADGTVEAVVLEVHNTYGGRHAYVVRPDAHGRTTVEKAFHVSPFNAVEGDYAVSLHLSPERAAVGIRLGVGGEAVLTATVNGECRPATPARVLATALRHPAMTQRVSALIRVHGIRLWARRLPVHPVPPRHPESLR